MKRRMQVMFEAEETSIRINAWEREKWCIKIREPRDFWQWINKLDVYVFRSTVSIWHGVCQSCVVCRMMVPIKEVSWEEQLETDAVEYAIVHCVREGPIERWASDEWNWMALFLCLDCLMQEREGGFERIKEALNEHAARRLSDRVENHLSDEWMHQAKWAQVLIGSRG